MNIKVGQRARQIRIQKGIKQSYISKKLGFRHSSGYLDIEMGRRNLPADKVPILADALGVSLDELFFEESIRETRNGVSGTG